MKKDKPNQRGGAQENLHTPPFLGVDSGLSAKIRSPRVNGVLNRPRLFEHLDNIGVHPITWISGPAGSGKTTLVASYLAERKLQSIWYQLDATDSDITNFFFYLRAAALQIARHRKSPLPILTPEYLPGVAVFARRFFDQLFTGSKHPKVLVLDNYQELPENCALHSLLAENLADLPQSVRVIVLSRCEPPSAWARVQASNAIGYTGWDELRLTVDESESIARTRITRKKVERDKIEQMHAITHGWAAGMVLMLQYEGNSQEPAFSDAMEGAEQATFNYFAQEIMRKQDSSFQNGLMKLAWLPAITPAAAIELTNDPQFDRVLYDLAKRKAFTYRYTKSPISYQFHPLFRRFLQSTANATFKTTELEWLQRTSADLLMRDMLLDEAAIVLTEAKLWPELSNLIHQHAQTLLAQGRNQTLESWLTSLPSEVRDRDPWLLMHFGGARFPFNLVESRGYYERAFLQFEQSGDIAGQILAWSSIIEAIYYSWSDASLFEPWLDISEKRFASIHDQLTDNLLKDRVVIGMFILLMSYRPQHPSMELWAKRMEKLVLSVPDKSLRIFAGAPLLQYYNLWLGDFARGSLLLDTLRPENMSILSPAAEIMWHATEAMYYFRRNEVSASHKADAMARDLSRHSGIRLWDFVITSIFVYLALLKQEYEQAADYLKTLSSLTSMQRPLQMASYQILHTFLARSRGEDAAALENARRLVMLTDWHGGPFEQGTACLELAYSLHNCGMPSDAMIQAKRALSLAEEMHSLWVTYLAHLCLATLELSAGNSSQCTLHLSTAFKSGRTNGFSSLHFITPRDLARLCVYALNNDIEPEYVRELVRMHRLHPDTPPLHIDGWPWPIKIVTLGRFLVINNGVPLEFPVKGQKKPIDLLKALIALGGRDIDIDTLSDLVWPDTEADSAQAALKINLHRLRKLVGDEAIILRGGRVSLNPTHVWVDTWAFQSLLESSSHSPEMRDLDLRLLDLYKGPFLRGDERCSWVIPTRERLRARFLGHILQRAHLLCEEGHFDKATLLYERGLDIDALSEELYRGLMTCYARTGRRAEALVLFERCRATLAATLKINPSPETEYLYQQISSER